MSFLFLNLRHIYGCTFVLFASIRLQVLFSLPRKFYESLSGFVLFLLRKSFGGKSKNDFLLYLLITLPVYFSKNPGERKDTRVLPYGMPLRFRFHLIPEISHPQIQRKTARRFSLHIYYLFFIIYSLLFILCAPAIFPPQFLHFAFRIPKKSVDRKRPRHKASGRFLFNLCQTMRTPLGTSPACFHLLKIP